MAASLGPLSRDSFVLRVDWKLTRILSLNSRISVSDRSAACSYPQLIAPFLSVGVSCCWSCSHEFHSVRPLAWLCFFPCRWFDSWSGNWVPFILRPIWQRFLLTLFWALFHYAPKTKSWYCFNGFRLPWFVGFNWVIWWFVSFMKFIVEDF
jgi:hypothetical protein